MIGSVPSGCITDEKEWAEVRAYIEHSSLTADEVHDALKLYQRERQIQARVLAVSEALYVNLPSVL